MAEIIKALGMLTGGQGCESSDRLKDIWVWMCEQEAALVSEPENVSVFPNHFFRNTPTALPDELKYPFYPMPHSSSYEFISNWIIHNTIS